MSIALRFEIEEENSDCLCQKSRPTTCHIQNITKYKMKLNKLALGGQVTPFEL